MIAAYIDYLMNLEENNSGSSDNRPISRWREFGLKKVYCEFKEDIYGNTYR